MKYKRKRPIEVLEIEAVRWTGDNTEEVSRLIGSDKMHFKENIKTDPPTVDLYVANSELQRFHLKVNIGDYIIYYSGSVVPCSPDEFEDTYEKIDQHPSPCIKCSMKSNGACCGCPEHYIWKEKYGDKK